VEFVGAVDQTKFFITFLDVPFVHFAKIPTKRDGLEWICNPSQNRQNCSFSTARFRFAPGPCFGALQIHNSL
jgi:hypothetical protein